jgi:hypothetical protein
MTSPTTATPTSTSTTPAAPAQQKYEEPGLSVGTDKMKQLTAKIPPPPPSVLDKLSQPIRLEDVQFAVFTEIFPKLAQLADDLGYGWVGGVNTNETGKDYVYVGPGTVITSSDKKTTITGPAFAPNLLKGPHPDANAGAGYMADVRTSFEFTDVRLATVASVNGGSPIMGPETEAQPQSITTFSVDNTMATNPTTSVFTTQVFTQSEVGAATQKSFSSDFHWDVSLTETFNTPAAEGVFFPTMSFSSTQSLGGNSSSSQSDSTSSNVTKGTTETHEFSHETPGGYLGEYSIMADTGTVAITFSTDVVLEFGVKIHGFLRWGGGKPFQGGTNYHMQYSGSGDRPVIDAVFGGKDESCWQALSDQVAQNSAPWAWKAMFEQISGSRANVEALIADIQANTKFPVGGVMATIARNNVRFKTISEVQPTPS